VWKTSAAPQVVQRVCLFCCSPIESSTKQFVKRHEAFGWISKKFGGLQASKILCSGLICSSAVEAALMISSWCGWQAQAARKCAPSETEAKCK